MYLSTDREHVAACPDISSIHTNAKLPLLRSHIATYTAVAHRIPAIQSPSPRSPFAACVLARMTCHVHSWCYTRHERLNFITPAH